MMQSDYSPTLEDVLPEFRGGELTLKSNTMQQGQNISAVVHEIDLNKAKANDMEHDPKPAVTNLPVDGIKITEGYFSSREYFLQRAEKDCQSLQEKDDAFVGGWLLTLVDHWDHEKERLVLLYEKSILIVKYDFIALTPVDCLRLPFEKLTKLTIGNLEYPKTSVAPKVQYIANQFTSVLGGLLSFTSSWKTATQRSYSNNSYEENQEPRRVRDGVRINFEPPHSAEPTWEKIWNPWSKDIPWLTFVSHPLLLKRKSDHKFDVQNFVSVLRDLLRDAIKTQTNAIELEQRERRIAEPIIQYQPIIMESYVGLSALVHNYSELGFFKVRRGKVSF